MELLKRYSRLLPIGFIAAGLLLIIISFAFTQPPTTAEIWLDGSSTPVTVFVDSPFVADWLLEAGVLVFPGDSMRYGGIRIPTDFKISAKNNNYLSYKPAVPINLETEVGTRRFYSGANTLGEALWEQDIVLKASDKLSLPLDTPLDQAFKVSLRRGKPVTIALESSMVMAPVTAVTVGGALAEAGYPLQFLDYSKPAASELIPEDRTIQVVRVREEVLTEDTIIPFSEERVSDPQMDVGQERILQTGENGVQTTTIRVRYEDGVEISRIVLSEWVSKAPVLQRIAFGGNVVEQTCDSSDGNLASWLEMDVYITSYLDTGSPMANGEYPYYGAIAVKPEWYKILKGSSIYVPGYGVGTVLDVCPGCVGKPWIDVFIPTDQYVPWSKTATVCFLSPAPPGFTGELP